VYVLYSTSSEEKPVASCCVHGDEPPYFIKGWEFLTS